MRLGTKLKAVEILLIEDNPGDVRLTIEALKECKIINNQLQGEYRLYIGQNNKGII